MAWDLGAQDRIPQGMGVQSTIVPTEQCRVGVESPQLRAGELEFPKSR